VGFGAEDGAEGLANAVCRFVEVIPFNAILLPGKTRFKPIRRFEDDKLSW